MTDTKETFESIRDWALETFGPVTVQRAFNRAEDEWNELYDEFFDCNDFALPEPDLTKAAEEAADVVIVLCTMPGVVEAVQRKMAINRSRKWQCFGDGTGKHIKETQVGV